MISQKKNNDITYTHTHTHTSTYRSYLLKLVHTNVSKYVVLWLLKDLKRDGTVVVFKGRLVVVSYCQLCASIDLIATRMRQIDRWMHLEINYILVMSAQQEGVQFVCVMKPLGIKLLIFLSILCQVYTPLFHAAI